MSDQKLSSASTSEFSQTKHSSFLRRCSISDPRLDILPEKALNPFNRVLSGLFDGNSAYSSKRTDSVESVEQDRHHQGNSFSTSPRDNNQQITQLHHQKEIPAKKTTTSSTSATPILRKSSTSIGALSPLQHNHFSTILEMAEDQGLTMSARQTPTQTTMRSATEMAAAGTPQKCNGGGFMRMFGSGGFLSKPLMHTEEENYRYIMALDR
uniref:Uncharacterized protein n=1 Tax=Meloidogyne enterolobii TaxID=390850 RepID=A0A6V7X948_MELEN|nr:unnamed protein product [Meloidogyne enterolobii]